MFVDALAVLQAVKAADEDELRPLRETVAAIVRGLGGLVLEEPAAPRWDEEIAAALSGFTQKLYRVLEQRLAVRMAACERLKDLKIRGAGLFGFNPRGATARPVCSASGALAQTAWSQPARAFVARPPGSLGSESSTGLPARSELCCACSLACPYDKPGEPSHPAGHRPTAGSWR